MRKRKERSGKTEICPVCGGESRIFRNGSRFGVGRVCEGCYESLRIAEEQAKEKKDEPV